MKRPVLIAALMLVAITVLATVWWASSSDIAGQPTGQRIRPNGSVRIDGHRFRVFMADTPALQTRGLAGISMLAEDEGMFFPYDQEPNVAFWMKGMLIPIDILWISENRIAGITPNIPPPPPGTPDQNLTRYPSPTDLVDGVLEIAAGRASALGIRVGDAVNYDHDK